MQVDQKEVAHTAMVIWELMVPYTERQQDPEQEDPIRDYVQLAMRKHGIAAIRYDYTQMAERIEELYILVGAFFFEPFDESFVERMLNTVFAFKGSHGLGGDLAISRGDMLIAWSLIYSSNEGQLVDLLSAVDFTTRRVVTLHSGAKEEVTDYFEGMEVPAGVDHMSEPYWSVSVAQTGGPSYVLADFPDEAIAQEAIEAIRAYQRSELPQAA